MWGVLGRKKVIMFFKIFENHVWSSLMHLYQRWNRRETWKLQILFQHHPHQESGKTFPHIHEYCHKTCHLTADKIQQSASHSLLPTHGQHDRRKKQKVVGIFAIDMRRKQKEPMLAQWKARFAEGEHFFSSLTRQRPGRWTRRRSEKAVRMIQISVWPMTFHT